MPTETLTAEAAPRDDLSALAWVHAELRKSLETALKSLRRFVKESDNPDRSDTDAIDVSALRLARAQLHQGAGALELVGQPQVAQVLRAAEAAVQRCVTKPQLATRAAVAELERLSFAVLDYLGRLLAGKPVPPLALFPQYAAAQALAGADRVHPADLWAHDFRWRQLPADPGVSPRRADDAARGEMEALVLALMRQAEPAAQRRMSQLCAELGAGVRAADPPELATLWQLAAAFFEAQVEGLVVPDVHTKRVASRLLSVLRSTLRGAADAPERLAQDLLFYGVRAELPADPQHTPRLAALQRVWPADPAARCDYQTAHLGLFDPAQVLQARKRVASAKDAWSAVAGGEMQRLQSLHEGFTLLADSLQRLFPGGDALGPALQVAAAQVIERAEPPAPALAMEVATSVLYLDAVLEDGELDQPLLGERVRRLAQRVQDVVGAADPEALEPWMEELYRRISDRQTMGSVVHELRASLSEVEKQIDQYFRDPSRREGLIPVPAQLSAMRGVLSVLGLEQASHAVVQMRDEVDALAQTEVDPQRAIAAGTFDRLADNLGALSFLIDMLSVQPQLAKSLFHFDAATGQLSAVMRQSERESAFAAFVPMPDTEAEAPVAVAATSPATDTPATPTSPAPAPAAVDSGLADDPEMREVFLEEAREVLAAARASLDALQQRADDLAELTSVRRAFHTLKGSGRMVGLNAFGEAAWACEQLYNARLASNAPMQPELQAFSAGALDYLADWIAAIADGVTRGHDAAAVVRPADALRRDGTVLPIDAPKHTPPAPVMEAAPAVPVPEAVEAPEMPETADTPAPTTTLARMVPGLPSAADLDLLTPSDLPTTLPAAAPAEPVESAAPAEPLAAPGPADIALPAMPDAGDDAETARPEAFEFSLDLDALDAASVAQAARAAADPVAEGAAPTAAPSTEVTPPPVVEPLSLRSQPAPRTDSSWMAVDSAGPWELPPAPPVAPPEPAAQTAPEEPLSVADAPVPEVVELAFDDLAEAFALAEPVAPFPAVIETDPAIDPYSEPSVEPSVPVDSDPTAADRESASERPVHDAAPALPVESVPTPEAQFEPEPLVPAEELVKVVGTLRIPIPLFNIFLNEADEQSRRLGIEVAEWSLEPHRPMAESTIALAHSIAGNSATVGYQELSVLARAFEHALMRSRASGHGRGEEPMLFNDVADEIRRLLHLFAAGFLRAVPASLRARVAAHEAWPVEVAPEAGDSVAGLPPEFMDEAEGAEPASAATAGDDAASLDEREDDGALDDVVDAVDADLFPIFDEEAEELLPQLRARISDWMRRPSDSGGAAACMRTLHTFKGGARLAGALRVGEMAHRLETDIERLGDTPGVSAPQIERLLLRADAMAAALERLRHPAAAPIPAASDAAPSATTAPVTATVESVPVATTPVAVDETIESVVLAPTADGGPATLAAADAPTIGDLAAPAAPGDLSTAIDWARFVVPAAADDALTEEPAAPAAAAAASTSGGAAASVPTVRVRAPLLDRLVNQAGEVSIARARIEAEVRSLHSSLDDLTENLERLRRHLRDIELQAETQISSRMEAAKLAAEAFDPLEMDRFTRFQEITRMMAESVNDVATVQRSLQRGLQASEDELAMQARLTRDLQDDLLRTRMVEFESLADRLYRVVRGAAKETGKSVRLDLIGGGIEVDRGVLERMIGPFEHLLRNSVAHGIEPADQRRAVGKDETGTITVTVQQEGNEVAVEVRDDGAGLDLQRIRQRGIERGLLAPEVSLSDAALAELIFVPGFSTSASVSGLAGRGVGMDVVRAEVTAMGGRVETRNQAGQGTAFRLLLPLTTAVTQVVMLRVGERRVAVPSTVVEVVRRVRADLVEQAYTSGSFDAGGGAAPMPFYWLGALLQADGGTASGERSQSVVVMRSAGDHVAVHVDEVIGHQEVVVKNLGPQLARLPGLAGVTLLPSGAVALIYNPVALSKVYGDEARERMRAARAAAPPVGQAGEPAPAEALAPLVLVVDDSLTVRRVTQRLLLREGYRVTLAKDGLDALEKLAGERPTVLLSDIEMPRMDGFDLVRNVRADGRLAGMPVIMITSRIAQKHRDLASELGVDHYLGKPFAEDELLALIARHAGADVRL